MAEIAASAALRERIRERLASLAKQSTGSSNLVQRATVLVEPLSMDLGEMTDKGSINQRLVLRNRAALVEQLYADKPGEHVICVPER
jgi:feruloyl-CoA synthase